ncbi:MAG: hypothetical protein GXP31_12685 [Kiritimatiellaeota bacterium]|nr:hypothetical protein [Kiritimatiellota bacterium]
MGQTDRSDSPGRKALPTGAVATVLVVVGLSAPLHAQQSLLRDASFDAYRKESPGPWEFRYGHKGGPYPKVRPFWCGKSGTGDADTLVGRHLSIEKTGTGAGAVLVGQRIVLPDPMPRLDLAIRYRCFCAAENRSGVVTLCVFTPRLWDRLPRTPGEAAETAPRADIVEAVVREQGPDVTSWRLGRVPTAMLQKALAPYAGKEIVVAVSFLTWHHTTEEWARFDTFWLGPPLPHIDPVSWPAFTYRNEPMSLSVDASFRDPTARVLLEYRAAGTGETWRQLAMAPRATGLYTATVPRAATGAPLEVRAVIEGERHNGPATQVKRIKLTQRPDHPNLFYSKTELARMREKAQTWDWARAVSDGIRRNADHWLAREFEPQVISGYWWHHYNCKACGARLRMEGPRRHVCTRCGKVWDNDILFHVYWSKVHGDHARAARDLALTYQMTGERKYARRAIEFLVWYADHYAEFQPSDKGGKVVSQTLDECVWLLQMMEAADLAYPAMTQDEARHIERDLIYAGAMYTRKYRGGIHNIRCWHNACWAAAGYFVGDPELVEFARGGKYGFVAQMEQGVLEDGMWYERSMGYHYYTISAIVYHLKAAMHAGDDLFKMPQVRKLLMFPLMITFPNLVAPSLNDGGFSTRPIPARTLELAAAWYADPVAMSALRRRYDTGAKRHGMEAWQFGEELLETDVFTPPPSMDLKGAGLAVLRRGQGKDAVCVMLEYGEHGGGHGHPDKLQLILYALGRQLCPDLGTTGYANPLHSGYYKTTPSHNTVTIGGRDMAGRSGSLLAFEANERFSAAVARTDRVYNGFVLTRRVLLGDGFIVDEFVVAGDREETLDWFLRADGKLSLGLDVGPIEETPLSKPYTYLKNLRGAETSRDWSARWGFGTAETQSDGARLVVTMKGEPGTQVAVADAPGGAGTGRLWGTLRVRRSAVRTRFVAVHQAVSAGAGPPPVRFDGRLVRIGNATVDLGEDDAAVPVLK